MKNVFTSALAIGCLLFVVSWAGASEMKKEKMMMKGEQMMTEGSEMMMKGKKKMMEEKMMKGEKMIMEGHDPVRPARARLSASCPAVTSTSPS